MWYSILFQIDMSASLQETKDKIWILESLDQPIYLCLPQSIPEDPPNEDGMQRDKRVLDPLDPTYSDGPW